MSQQRDDDAGAEIGQAGAMPALAAPTASPLIGPAKGTFLARHIARLARTPGERTAFQRVLAVAHARVRELEELSQDADAAIGGDAAAIARFRETLTRAIRSGIQGRTRRAPEIDDPLAFARGFAGAGPCNGGLRLVEPAEVARVRVAIDSITARDPAMHSRSRETLAGLWDRGRALDRLYDDAVTDNPRAAAYVRSVAERIGVTGPGSPDSGPRGLPGDDGIWPPPGSGGLVDPPWPDEPPTPDIPDFCDQARRLCEELVINGFSPRTLPRSAFTTGITGVEPQDVCPGEMITIRGASFGPAQPADVVVLVDSLIAQVTLWTDTAITVIVPNLARSGCVGFLNQTIEAERRLLDELNRRDARDLNVGLRCLGGGEEFPILPYLIDSPDCMGTNFVSILRARVVFFSINGQSDVTVAPGTPLRLSWAAQDAVDVFLQRVGSDGPDVPPGAQPLSGFADLGPWTDNRIRTATYRVTAHSRCRTDTAEVHATLFQPGLLTIAGLELVQAIQRWDVNDPANQNTVRLAAGKTTVVRTYVDFDGAGFDYGDGPGRAPRVDGEVRLSRPGGGLGFTVPIERFTQLPTGRLLDRSLRSGSLMAIIRAAGAPQPLEGVWQISVAVEATDMSGRSIATAVLPPQSFTFHVRREVWFVAYRVRDNANNLPAPTMNAVAVSLNANIDRLPLDDTDAVPAVFPPPLVTDHDFTLMDGDDPDREPWEDMLDDLEDVAGDNPVTPVSSGRGTPLVTYCAFLPDPSPLPAGGYNGIGGIANFGSPELVAITLPLGAIMAHEFGHTLDLDHAPGPDTPKDEIDPRLVNATEDHGFDSGVDSGALGAVVRQGTNDFMGDFGGSGVSTRTWDTVFDIIGPP